MTVITLVLDSFYSIISNFKEMEVTNTEIVFLIIAWSILPFGTLFVYGYASLRKRILSKFFDKDTSTVIANSSTYFRIKR